MDIYAAPTPAQRLAGNTYPGRGILIGRTADGTKAVAAYFIMGRSVNSRNRIFTERSGEVFTEPFDPALVKDPSLIPSFCGEGFYGLRVHEAALAKGVKVTGATVHYVNEIPDGGEILLQKAVRVYPGDTPEKLQLRVMRQAEWKLLPAAIQLVARKLLAQKSQAD